MIKPKNILKVAAACLLVIGLQPDCSAQTAFPAADAVEISAAARAEMQTQLARLKSHVADLKKSDVDTRLVADVEVYAKAAEWILRHGEFYQAGYVDQTLDAIKTGTARAKELAAGKPASWVAAHLREEPEERRNRAA